ncbi:hypothetical protein GCM10028791_44050 [Echinicola sediminis]
MANTYHQMYVHTVFSVKFRKAFISNQWKTKLFAVIGSLINETGCKTLIVNGTEDHVHCFFSLLPSVTVSEVMKHAKAKSSKWVNEKNLIDHRFEWQKGFGAFTYSKSHVSNVFKYIENQETHHQKLSFREEYIQMLNKFGIPYEEKFIFHPPLE